MAIEIKRKKKVVIVGIYLPGIYPAGQDDVVSRLLAPSFLKAAADADAEISKSYDIKILDIRTDTPNGEVVQEILSENPDVVAYSTYMWNYDQVSDSLASIKEQFPSILTILGGPLVSYTPEDVMAENPGADILVRGGGGELRFRQLLRSDFSDAALMGIPKISFRNADKLVVHTDGEVNEDVTEIPSVFEMGAHDLNDGRKHTVFVETYRGCPFSCGYCIWGPEGASIHKFDLDQLCRDIDTIYNNPNVETVFFTDACLFYTRKRARVVCDRIGAASRSIPTVFTLDAHVLDEDMCRYLAQVNLYQNQWHFGIQTTTPDALEILQRPGGGKSEMYIEKINLLRKYCPDAEISFDVIYGLPGDDFRSFRETVDFTLRLRPSKIHFSPLLLLPGTRFYNDRERLGFIYDDRPPYMVRANQTFSSDDMQKAIDLVLWVMAVLYYPAIRDTIFDLCEFDQNLSPVDVIEEWVDELTKHVNPVAAINHEFTVEANNEVRRSVMNTLTTPENSILCYESILTLVKKYGASHLAETVELGLSYYRSQFNGLEVDVGDSAFDDASQFVDQGIFNVKDTKLIEHIKTAWVTSA